MRWFSRWDAGRKGCASKWSRGQAMAEYAMVLVLVAIAVYAAYTATGQNVKSLVGRTNSSLASS